MLSDKRGIGWARIISISFFNSAGSDWHNAVAGITEFYQSGSHCYFRGLLHGLVLPSDFRGQDHTCAHCLCDLVRAWHFYRSNRQHFYFQSDFISAGNLWLVFIVIGVVLVNLYGTAHSWLTAEILMNLVLLFTTSPVIQLHLISAFAACCLGTAQLILTKGSLQHRLFVNFGLELRQS